MERFMIAGEIKKYFVAYDLCYSPNVIVNRFIGFEADITLLSIAELIVDDELNSPVELVIEKLFYLVKIGFSSAAREDRKFLAAEIEIGVIIFPFVKAPEPLLKLHTVLPESH